MKFKTILLLSLLAFGVTLAVMVGRQLSAEAMAVIVGVVAGVAASIPTSLIIVWVATRPANGQRAAPAPPARATPAPEPRVVVIQPQPAAPSLASPAYSYTYPQPGQHLSYTPAYAPPPQRNFTVIGGETLEDEPQLAWATDEADLA